MIAIDYAIKCNSKWLIIASVVVYYCKHLYSLRFVVCFHVFGFQCSVGRFVFLTTSIYHTSAQSDTPKQQFTLPTQFH